MKKVFKIIAGVIGGFFMLVFAIGVIGAMANRDEGGNASANATPARRPAPRPVVEVTAGQLGQECDENEVAFEQRYKDVNVRITGEIQSINAGISGASLSLGPMFKGTQATDLPKEALINLKKGQTVAVLCGRVSEVIGSVVASDCKLL